MQRKHLRFGKGFKVGIGNEYSRSAELTILPGEIEGGPDNRHGGADQWMYVAAGEGKAVINGESFAIKSGSLVLIERGDRHEIRNTGSEPLRTLNLYVPPAFDTDGEPLPAARP